MNGKKFSEKQRGHLKLAYEAQQIADPYLKQGGYSLIEIYLNYVVKHVPVCINTFRKMMKEDVSDYPQIAEEYQRKVKYQYLNLLQDQSRKRIKATWHLKKKRVASDQKGETEVKDSYPVSV